MKYLLFLVSILLFSTADGQVDIDNDDPELKKGLAIIDHVGALRMFEVTFDYFDENCGTSYGLSEGDYEELNRLVLKKTGLTYDEMIQSVGDPDNPQKIIDSNPAFSEIVRQGCGKESLDYSISLLKISFDTVLERLRNSEETDIIKENVTIKATRNREQRP